MKKLVSAVAFVLLLVSVGSAQDVKQKDAVKTTKVAQKNARQMQKDAEKSGSSSQKAMADKTMDAAKRAEKQAKKNN